MFAFGPASFPWIPLLFADAPGFAFLAIVLSFAFPFVPFPGWLITVYDRQFFGLVYALSYSVLFSWLADEGLRWTVSRTCPCHLFLQCVLSSPLRPRGAFSSFVAPFRPVSLFSLWVDPICFYALFFPNRSIFVIDCAVGVVRCT